MLKFGVVVVADFGDTPCDDSACYTEEDDEGEGVELGVLIEHIAEKRAED